MPNPTLSTRIRAIQDQLNAIDTELTVLLDDAYHIGLAPVRIAGLHHAIANNQHASNALNDVATTLELTHADRKL